MALVAYDNSDSSEYEDEDSENTTVVLNNPLEAKSSLKLPEPVQKQVAIQSQEENQESSSATLFNLLPQPSIKKPVVIEENDEYLLKKENANVNKPKAKITVPSLNDFKDVDTNTPIAKLKAHNKKTSGLLSLLPQPRNGVKATTKSLIPNILKTKPVPAKKEPLPSSLKNVKFNAAPVINDYSDDSDPEEVQNDFFAMNKPVCISTDADMSLEIEQYAVAQASNNTQKPRGIESFFKKDDLTHMQLHGDYGNDDIQDEAEASSTYNLNIAEENSNSNEVALDEEAILKLCGARGKRKREQIQIVDVNQEEVLADARKMLLKGLMDDTTKRVSASKKKGNEPTTQQRRKHQITYLAYQAKANEAELQNQWANNRMSKKQTQAKYGF